MDLDCSEFGASTGDRPTGSDFAPPLPPLPPRPKTVWLGMMELTMRLQNRPSSSPPHSNGETVLARLAPADGGLCGHGRGGAGADHLFMTRKARKFRDEIGLGLGDGL